MSPAEPFTVRAGRRDVPITHPDKVLFPRDAITKADLARYCAEIAPAMVPHTRGRPVAMHVFPGGIDGRGHYAKNVQGHFPDWIPRATLAKRGGTITHVLADDAATLVYLAGQNVITVHVWPARAEDPRRPDRVIFDLDPGDVPFSEVRAAAREVGDAVRDAGLVPYAMVSGSRGIHVVAPIRPGPEFPAVFRWAKGLGDELAARHPDRLTTEFYKHKRRGPIFVDTRRNAYAQHAVAPYAVRPRDGAPVATPLRWEELDDRGLRPDGWNVRSVVDRVRDGGDPWQGIDRRRRSLRA
ncbi:MAG: bifunctional non-ous end joining protein LigD [Solirubrobacteraceae bacterium]|jgi:bifunctional non-homologous end joining protein LigD|nr:bifunctional non-ous end joining protein LigD [Solirubrobacteraceae bacterium]